MVVVVVVLLLEGLRGAIGMATEEWVCCSRAARRQRQRACCQHTSAYVSIRQHTSAYVSIRQHTSAYVSMR